MLEKQVRQQMRSRGIVVGLQRTRDAADRKIMRDGHAATRPTGVRFRSTNPRAWLQ